MKNKKSELSMKGLIALLVMIAVGILLGGFYNQAEAGIESPTYISACKLSITAISTAKEGTKGFLNTARLNCPAPTHNFTSVDAIQNVPKITTTLVNCWEKTTGTNNRLGNEYALFMDFLKADGDLCLVCSTFFVDKETPAYLIKQYLIENKIHITSWNNDHIFIDVLDTASNVRLAEFSSWYTTYTKIKGIGTVHEAPQKAWELEKFIPGTEYYVMSINAAKSKTDDFNMILIIAEEDTDNLKCKGDVIFHQKVN